MITYPTLTKGMTIGVTATSSGVPDELHPLLHSAFAAMEKRGYAIQADDTVWTQSNAKSSPAKHRAKRFNDMMQNPDIDLIIPPWGGELLIECLEWLDFEKMQPKWVLGYSDTSTLLLAITLKTGIATAHGTNLIDLRGTEIDDTTAMWETVCSTALHASNTQVASTHFQKEWRHDAPSPCVFHLTEPTQWKAIPTQQVTMEGRLLGGCIDTIRHLIGTPFGEVDVFKQTHLSGEPIVWYLENCELTTPDLRRSLVQMKYAGWFNDCAGILFGRSATNTPVDNYTATMVYEELAEELHIPILYDIDCGHMPPQLTFINGAYVHVEAENERGTVTQTFRP